MIFFRGLLKYFKRKLKYKSKNRYLARKIPGIGLSLNGPVNLSGLKEYFGFPKKSYSKRYCHQTSAIIKNKVAPIEIRKYFLEILLLNSHIQRAIAKSGHLIKAREYKKLSEEFILNGVLISSRYIQKIKLKTNHCCLIHCQLFNL